MSTLMKMKMQPSTLEAVIAAKSAIMRIQHTEEGVRQALYYTVMKDLPALTREECDEFINNFEIEGLT